MKNTNILLIGLAIVLIITAFLVLSQNEPKDIVEKASPVPSVISEKDNTETTTGAEDTVRTFMNNFLQAAPPEADERALDEAVLLLSEGAKMGMETEPTSGDLAIFVKIQNPPDQGYEIGEVIYKDNPATGEEKALAEVTVTLEYLEADLEKVFQLSKFEESWKIDAVE
jgi:hypothetical protein